MRGDAIWSRVIIVQAAGLSELTPDESAEEPLELQSLGVDDIDCRVRAIGKIEFGSIGIDEADVERPQRASGDGNGRQASGLGCEWLGKGAVRCHGTRRRQRHCSKQDSRDWAGTRHPWPSVRTVSV